MPAASGLPAPLRAVQRRLRAHPVLADGLLALLVAGLSLPGLFLAPDPTPPHPRPADALGVLLVLGATLPITWRRRHPQLVLAVTAVCTVVGQARGYTSGGNGVGMLVALYSVGTLAPRRRSLAALALALVGVAAALAVSPYEMHLDDYLGNLLVFVTAWVLGSGVRTRRLYTAELERRNAWLEDRREAEARRAVLRERARIARELHDVVAHHVSVVVVQAQAGQRALARDPETARQTLATVESTGRSALVEMRRLLGVLRTDDAPEPVEHEPQPDLDQLTGLVEAVRDSGLPVHLEVSGAPRRLTRGVGLTAYRIVQEALTNALKHAGPAQARVLLHFAPDELEVRVDDDGRGSAAALAPAADGAGQGLVGMAERVAMLGGTLRTGPRTGGGFSVRARLPLEPAADRVPDPDAVPDPVSDVGRCADPDRAGRPVRAVS